MPYATASAILAKTSADILVEVLTPQAFSNFSQQALGAVINNTSTAEFSSDEIAAANAVLVIINNTITTVDDEIDLYLNKQYELPINSPTIDDISADLCVYRLLADHADEFIINRNKEAKALLDRIAKGEVQLYKDNRQDGIGDTLVDGGSNNSITDGYA